jgi:hypothetical protein
MSDEPLDFSTLNLPPESEERMVGQIMWRVQSELARRRGRRELSVVEVMAAWYRPAFAAAAAIAAVSLTMLAVTRPARSEVTTGAYMSSNEVPAALTSWYEEDSLPTAAELLVANEGGTNGSVR